LIPIGPKYVKSSQQSCPIDQKIDGVVELAPGKEWSLALEPLRECVAEISETFCRTHVTSRPEIKIKPITSAGVRKFFRLFLF
jgi:hypothetical protein